MKRRYREGKAATKYGIYLPHTGEQATPALIRSHAECSGDLRLEDIWVSEHMIVPWDKLSLPPLFFDPVLSLTWAAAGTRRPKRRRSYNGCARHARGPSSPSLCACSGTVRIAMSSGISRW